MNRLYTIGFTKKDARTFFGLLMTNNVTRLIDVRLNNLSQLTGFTKKNDLEYFLDVIGGIGYSHITQFAPTQEMLSDYKKHKISWQQYEELYFSLMKSRKAESILSKTELANACFLCSEPTAMRCHRRLLAEYLTSCGIPLEIVHL